VSRTSAPPNTTAILSIMTDVSRMGKYLLSYGPSNLALQMMQEEGGQAKPLVRTLRALRPCLHHCFAPCP
jgi:hypothetical protein